MIKDHYLVCGSDQSEVRHVIPNERLLIGLRFVHSHIQFILTIYQLEMVLHLCVLYTIHIHSSIWNYG